MKIKETIYKYVKSWFGLSDESFVLKTLSETIGLDDERELMTVFEEMSIILGKVSNGEAVEDEKTIITYNKSREILEEWRKRDVG